MGHPVAPVDHSQPVEVADRIWWVGHLLPDDPFQCHVYLIEHGTESILIDPGSPLTFPHTLRKIEKIIPFDHIRYFLCSHQDPDIAAALPQIDEMVTRPDARIVTDWRAAALLKHYGLKLPFWLIDKNDWRLDLGGRVLEFVLTPYLHFPGAFATFDPATRTLFSSDLFGGFTEEPRLYAEDESYFEAIRPFHEHYMPSREILSHTLDKLAPLDIRVIAPQHGSIIPSHLIRPVIDRMRDLECGVYLRVEQDTDIMRLSQLNTVLRDVLQCLVLHRKLRRISGALVDIFRRVLPVTVLEFYVDEVAGQLHLDPGSGYRGVPSMPPPEVCRVLAGQSGGSQDVVVHDDETGRRVLLPLKSPSRGQVRAVAVLQLADRVDLSSEVRSVLGDISTPLQVAVESELMYRALDLKRHEMYQRSIRDPLTGLHNRSYLHDEAERLFAIHDREAIPGISVLMVDIDYFKRVNDAFGHAAGDMVLRRVADVLEDETRKGDLAVRLGGEEFALFLVGLTGAEAERAAERLRQECSRRTSGTRGGHVTVSVGVTERQRGEPLVDVLQRADDAMYAAKAQGRNRVCLI